MIKKPVKFTDEQVSIIGRFQDKEDHNCWSDDALIDIRKSVKQHYIREQEYRCCYCQQKDYSEHGRDWDAEHVIARSLEPKFMFTPENLAVSCVECDQRKSATEVRVRNFRKFPQKSSHYKIVHPHFDDWSEHLEIEGGETYVALTEKGKFTIYHCDLFRFRQRKMNIERPIRDKRFERDIGELRFAKSLKEAEPIIASIRARLHMEALDDEGKCETTCS